MSVISYVVNWDELSDLLKQYMDTNVTDLSKVDGVQKSKGFVQSVPAMKGDYIIFNWIPDEDIILTGITYSQSAFKAQDYWELYAGEEKLFETVFTKEQGEQKHFEAIHYIKKGTAIKLILSNQSGNSRYVWADIDFVQLKPKENL